MTLEELLNAPEKIESLSDAELLKYFEPYLKYTRPELAEKPVNNGPSRAASAHRSNPVLDEKKRKAMEIAAKLGIKLDL